MTCETCDKWVLKRLTRYDDGSEIVHFTAADGMGNCEHLKIGTPHDFSCSAYNAGSNQIRVEHKSGAPWQFWRMGPCPECSAKGNAGDGACHRCAGTSNVRYYEDGFVGDERTRMHPKEREVAAVSKPTCGGCSKEVDAGWMACPYCGGRLEAPAKTEVVSDSLRVG
jgi:hypothetical protein